MKLSIWIVLLISLAGDMLVFAASSVLLIHKRTVALLEQYATPFAAGALLAAAFLDFLHEGVERYEPFTVLLAALVGIVFFFMLENWLHWFHHHSKEAFETHSAHKEKRDPVVVLATGGNWLHNFIDGAAIAGAFLISTSAGLITTIAVALHEIPREMADSGYLLKRGLKRRGVLLVHGLAMVATSIGTLLFYITARDHAEVMAWLLGATAGFFIYIAASDIIPSINAQRRTQQAVDGQVALLLSGVVLVGSAIMFAHRFIA